MSVTWVMAGCEVGHQLVVQNIGYGREGLRGEKSVIHGVAEILLAAKGSAVCTALGLILAASVAWKRGKDQEML